MVRFCVRERPCEAQQRGSVLGGSVSPARQLCTTTSQQAAVPFVLERRQPAIHSHALAVSDMSRERGQPAVYTCARTLGRHSREPCSTTPGGAGRGVERCETE
eukprot:229877-Rhodomonas_salina.1